MRTRWILVLLASLLHMPASADGISVFPTTVTIDRTRQVGSLTIRNQGDKEAVYELAGYRWTQTDGNDTLTPDKSFVVTPPVVMLGAGEERVVRVGILSDAPKDIAERAYRLRITELPPLTGQSGASLNVRLQLLLPVFEEQAGRKEDLQFSAYRQPGGNTCIEAHNAGDAHAKLVWVASPGTPDSKMPVQKYLLAGSQGALCVDIPAGSDNTLTVGVASAHQRDIQPYEMSIAEP